MDNPTQDETQAMTEQQARVQAALQAYEDARIDGLCEDGAWERAAEVLRALGGVESLETLRQEEGATELVWSGGEPRGK